MVTVRDKKGDKLMQLKDAITSFGNKICRSTTIQRSARDKDPS